MYVSSFSSIKSSIFFSLFIEFGISQLQYEYPLKQSLDRLTKPGFHLYYCLYNNAN